MNSDRASGNVGGGMGTLRHVAFGRQHWEPTSGPAYHRPNWEFVAVLSGRAASTVAPDFAEPRRAPSLWVFAPGVAHGWTGDAPAGNRVAVFEYSAVSPILEEFVREVGWLEVRLDSSGRAQLEQFAREIQRHVLNRSALTRIYATKVLVDMSVLLLRDRLELNGRAPRACEPRLLVHRYPANSTED